MKYKSISTVSQEWHPHSFSMQEELEEL